MGGDLRERVIVRRTIRVSFAIAIVVVMFWSGLGSLVEAKGGPPSPQPPTSLGCFGFVYHPRFDDNDAQNIAVLDYLKSIQITTITAPIRWDTTQQTGPTSVFTDYDRFFNLAAERSIKIIPELAISCTPDWALDMYDQSEQRTNLDIPIREATNHYTDPELATAPFALNHTLNGVPDTGIRGLAKSFTIDAINQYKSHPAFGGAWILSNEPIFPTIQSDPTVFYDYSDSTINSFREWLYKRANGPSSTYDPGSSAGLTGPSGLLARWGFEATIPWSNWGAIDAPRSLSAPESDRTTTKTSYWEDWMEFRESHLAHFIRWHSEIVRGADSTSKIVLKVNSWVTLKGTAAQAGFNYYTVFKTAPLVNVYAIDFYPEASHIHSLVRENELVMHLSMMRGLINDQSKELWIGELGEEALSNQQGTDMMEWDVRRMTELCLANGFEKVFFYDIDPQDFRFSFYYHLGQPGSSPSNALNMIIGMNTGSARPDIKCMLDADNSKLKPQVGVVFGLPDVYQVAYWWNTGRTPAAWDYPSRETLSKFAVCQALYLNNVPYVLLNENHIRENGVPSYVHVLFMPAVSRISSDTATRIQTYASTSGNYLWGDLRAGEYSLEDQEWKSGVAGYLMNEVFGASSFGTLIRDVNEFDNRPIRINSGAPTEHLPENTILYGTHDENVVLLPGATEIAEFTVSPQRTAIWTYGRTERVASNISVAQYHRISGNEDQGQINDILTFQMYIVDFVLWGQGMYLSSPFTGVQLTTTVAQWDDAYLSSKTIPCASFFMKYETRSTITYTVDHLAKSASYKVSYTKTGGTTTTKSWTTDTEGKLTMTFSVTAGTQYFVALKKA